MSQNKKRQSKEKFNMSVRVGKEFRIDVARTSFKATGISVLVGILASLLATTLIALFSSDSILDILGTLLKVYE